MLTSNQRDILAGLVTCDHAKKMIEKELPCDLLILYEMIRKQIEEADIERSEDGLHTDQLDKEL